MTDRDIEAVYEAIATQIDKVGPANAELYLAKLALLLANEIGDHRRALKCVTDASASLTEDTAPGTADAGSHHRNPSTAGEQK
ncbi:DUF2783 domain-containing protein [Leisingera sp. ANG59]|uniref:DUF2783 domain-containing protein n=1 Tax=Leisingera sp. ANG59 TaxID=2675221 RepID=UPI0015717426|nr:DUF2783 domain-containing protein [Leisingera sp. ANG59]